MNTLWQLISLVLLVIFITYLGYHALHGEQGHLNHRRIKAQIAMVEAELAEVRAIRTLKEDRVSRLRIGGSDAAVDVDYLEERARYVLRFAHPDEIVVRIDWDHKP